MVMTAFEVFLAWVGIGLAISIPGWIWPFRRGVSGIVINACVAIAGAVAFGFAARTIGSSSRLPWSFLAAFVGAVLAIGALHLLWGRHVQHERRIH